jgi:23S rRNA pseudouridine1911/1915/1917 synthase
VSSTVRLQATESNVGQRADLFVAGHLQHVSRAAVQSLFRHGHVSINSRPSKSSHRMTAGDVVDVRMALPPSLAAAPEAIPLDVVYRDCDLAVVNKPAGLVVHPAPGHPGGTLVNALAAMFPDARSVGSKLRPGVVHRLDKDTSGLMVVALTAEAHASLQAQIAGRTSTRRYLAIVRGQIFPESGVIDAPIGRHRIHRTRMAVHGLRARPARTSYRVLEHLLDMTYLEATLHTGRTHQIRVHLAAVDHPVVGDALYGGGMVPGLERQFLHAHRLAVTSPSTGVRLEFESPLPPDLQAFIEGARAGQMHRGQ